MEAKPESFRFAEIEKIDALSESELDQLPFGVIHLDREGNILGFNRHEVTVSGHSASSVRGKNFFTEVAPCTNVQDFAGRFRAGVAAENLHAVFPYLFDFRTVLRRVWVTLFYSQETNSAWLFIRDDRE